MPITPENAHLWLPIVQAMAEGKTIECKIVDGWRDSIELMTDSAWTNPTKLRIKRAIIFRPWRPEEVPVGAVVKGSLFIHPAMIICSCPITTGEGNTVGPESAMELLMWKWPHEPDSAWKRCGVEK